MATAFQHRPMSEILAPAPDSREKAPTDDKSAAAPDTEAKALPDKYQGKSVEQVAEMHQNAEKRLGQIQNELGTMRGLVSDLSAIQRPASEPKPAEQEPVNVSGDDLLSDPVEAVRKIVKQDLEAVQASADATASQNLINTEGVALANKYGDIDAIVSTDEFQTFATRTPSRLADFNTAATGEGLDQIRAARRLLEDYEDFTQATSTDKEKEPTAVEKARKVATEGSYTGAPISSKPQIFESDVITLINTDVTKYRSPSFQKELMAAIKEGRFVKNS